MSGAPQRAEEAAVVTGEQPQSKGRTYGSGPHRAEKDPGAALERRERGHHARLVGGSGGVCVVLEQNGGIVAHDAGDVRDGRPDSISQVATVCLSVCGLAQAPSGSAALSKTWRRREWLTFTRSRNSPATPLPRSTGGNTAASPTPSRRCWRRRRIAARASLTAPRAWIASIWCARGRRPRPALRRRCRSRGSVSW